MRLSIITINRNNVIGLRKTIESVVCQAFKDFEYIIIDGASTDGSVDVIKEYHDSITYWVSEPDKGIYNAMNKGIKVAKGEYCYFLNSGDWLYDCKILEMVFNENINSDIISGNILKKTEVETSPQIFTIRNLLIKNIPHQAMFIKKKLFENDQMYNEGLKILSDFLFNIQVCLKGVSYKYINLIIANYDTTGISNNNDHYQLLLDEEKYILNKTLPCAVQDDYKYFLNKKTFNHPSIRWLIKNNFLFKLIKGLNLVFNKTKEVYD
ncbi:MAG: glycosyltransferase family 2 protein [Paludibacter sp.]|jgi:glycosyltransferase involved in cell wall biosynthesis